MKPFYMQDKGKKYWHVTYCCGVCVATARTKGDIIPHCGTHKQPVKTQEKLPAPWIAALR